MKSAYELAMERLNKTAPVTPLTDQQKAEIAEIDNLFQSKIAERELFLQSEINKAIASGDQSTQISLSQQLRSELSRLREDCEEKKEKVRNRKA